MDILYTNTHVLVKTFVKHCRNKSERLFFLIHHIAVILLQDALCVCVPKHIDRASVCGNTIIVFSMGPHCLLDNLFY